MKYLCYNPIASIAVLAIFLIMTGCTERGTNTPIYTQESTADSSKTGGTGLVNTTRGKELFQQKCAACHGANGDARNNKAADLSMTRLDSLGIATTVLNGRGTMPPFRGAIADSDLSGIIVYVRTLRANMPN
jgi:mono/diheme cytochrome c family protein